MKEEKEIKTNVALLYLNAFAWVIISIIAIVKGIDTDPLTMYILFMPIVMFVWGLINGEFPTNP